MTETEKGVGRLFETKKKNLSTETHLNVTWYDVREKVLQRDGHIAGIDPWAPLAKET